MYCINCGVELAESERLCPLCGTRVFHPELPQPQGKPTYPTERGGRQEAVNRSGFLFVLTMLALLPVVICLLCDWRINGEIVWAGFVAGGVMLFYVAVVFPMWFPRPNPVIFVPLGFAAVILYLLYIDLEVKGGWFLSFAFPVAGAIGLLLTAVVALIRYVRGGYLYIFGGALILSGGLAVLIEFLLNVTFGVHEVLFWSLYPLAAGVILGGMLIVIAICAPLRRSLHRKFFL